MSMQKNKITIGLLWHSVSSDNLGVGALTESQIAICESALKRAGIKAEYIIFGTTGGKFYPPSGVSVSYGSRISIKQMLLCKSAFLKELNQCDIVLDIGEGDSFADIYGIKRYIFLIASKIAVLYKKIPLILSPQTIGPFDKWLPKLLATWVMRRAHHVFARDGLSFKYLTESGIDNNVSEVIDVAFRLPFQKVSLPETTKIRVGINVSGLLFSGGYTQNNQFGLTLDYPKFIRHLIKTIVADDKYQVWLIPHVIPDDLPVEDDRKAIQVLASEFPSVFVPGNFNSPSEAKSFIAAMDFVTGARMHACIAAFSSGVAVVPLAYSRKFNGLFNSLGYSRLADAKQMSSQQSIDSIMHGLENIPQLKAEIAESNKLASSKLMKYEDYLFDLIKKIKNSKG